MMVESSLTQKWLDQNHTSRSTRPIPASTAASVRAFASFRKICRGTGTSAGASLAPGASALACMTVASPAPSIPGAAAGQVGGDKADAGPLQFGEHRAARIGGNSGDRAGARTEPEAMQGQGSRFGIESHRAVLRTVRRRLTPRRDGGGRPLPDYWHAV